MTRGMSSDEKGMSRRLAAASLDLHAIDRTEDVVTWLHEFPAIVIVRHGASERQHFERHGGGRRIGRLTRSRCNGQAPTDSPHTSEAAQGCPAAGR